MICMNLSFTDNLHRACVPVIRGSLLAMTFLLMGGCVTSGPEGSSVKNRPVTDKAMVHTKLAEGYLKQKQYAVAKSELEQALKINSNHSESNYVMALLMLELQQYEDTEKYFKRAVKSNKKNSEAAHDFGTFLCQIGKERESIKYFEIAASNPLFEQPHLSYMRAGECLSRIDDPTAESYLLKALSVNPRMGPALYRLAVIKYESREFLSARAYVQRFMAITEPQPASLLLAYKIESKMNADEYANKYRSQLIENFPASKQAKEVRGLTPKNR